MSTPRPDRELIRALEFAFEPDEVAHAQIGPYKLLERIGEGGFGVVWMAEQEEPLRRRVALKIIKTGMDTRELIARFEAERQALALMEHPNIARVFDAGATRAGRPYFVMELVRGAPMTQYCDEYHVPTPGRLRLFVEACKAVQHAHQKGILHRDLKPSNILITLHDGKPVPKIIDFGIAKALGDARLTDKTLFTRFHTFIGTPAYTSPEQIELSGLDVDTRSDIYSLGVLLYELLTGQPPFDPRQLDSAGLHEARRTIREVDPPRPSQRLRTLDAPTLDTVARQRGTEPGKLALVLRGDLDWVVMRCLEKDRGRRYESAAALGVDVERHLAHEPVAARPPSAAYVMAKLVRRHRVAFAAAATIGAVLVLGTGISTWHAIRATQAEREQSRLRKTAQIARAAAEAQELAARRRAYASDMNVLQQALSAGNLGHARQLLDRHRPLPGQHDMRDWEWRYLWQFCQGDAKSVLAKQQAGLASVAVSADGEWLAAAPSPSLWNLRTGDREEIQLPGHLTRVAFSPNEPILALAGFRWRPTRVTQIILWNFITRQTVKEWTFSPTGDACTGLFFSDDGRTLVTSTASVRNEIGLWRVATGERLRSISTAPAAGQERYAFFAISRGLKLAAYVSRGDCHVHVHDLVNDRELWSKRVGVDWVTALGFSPDGKILASGEAFQESPIRLWDALSGSELGRMDGHRRGVAQLLFWPDGKTLASASFDQTVRLWDVANRRLLRTLRGHTNEVHSLALLPDDATLVSGSKNGELLLWDVMMADSAARAVTTIPGNLGEFKLWRFSNDGRAIITVDRTGRLAERRGENYRDERTLLQLRATSEFGNWPADALHIGGADWSAATRDITLLAEDAARVAHVSGDGNIEVWDWERGTRVSVIATHEGRERLAPVGFAEKGETLLLIRFVPRVGMTREEWDLRSGRRTRSWQPVSTKLQVNAELPLSVSPDRKYFMSVVDSVALVRTELDSGNISRLELDLRNAGPAGRFTPNGALFAAPTWNGLVHIVQVEPLRRMTTLSGFFLAAHSVAFSPDGRRLATSSGSTEAVMLWDMGSYDRVLTLQADGSQFKQAAFSPDGNMLGALSGVPPKTTLHFWRAPTWAEIEAAEKTTASKAP